MAMKQDTRRSSPQRCRQLKPNSRSIRFAGKYISLSDLANSADIDPSYASYIFSGKREGSIPVLRRISNVLGMSMDAFLDALDDHKNDLAIEYHRKLAG